MHKLILGFVFLSYGLLAHSEELLTDKPTLSAIAQADYDAAKKLLIQQRAAELRYHTLSAKLSGAVTDPEHAQVTDQDKKDFADAHIQLERLKLSFSKQLILLARNSPTELATALQLTQQELKALHTREEQNGLYASLASAAENDAEKQKLLQQINQSQAAIERDRITLTEMKSNLANLVRIQKTAELQAALLERRSGAEDVSRDPPAALQHQQGHSKNPISQPNQQAE